MMPSLSQRILFLICTAYVILALVYSIVTPVFEASDELWHYPMVKIIADTGQLPIQDPANIGPWRQEGSQPPLYYMVAAALTSWVDTDDMDYYRRQNPHADIGLVLPDGNVNMITHRPEEPWQGAILAVHIVRFFSVVLGLGTVLVTWQLARELYPNEPVIQLGATAFVAFLPMFLFISGAVNNDNLSNLTGNLLLLLIVRLIKQRTLPSWRQYALLGLATGAGLLAKLSIGFMIPIIALSLLILSLRLRNWRPLIIGGIISGGLTILIAGWWYLRNYQLYGDPTGLNVFLDIVGRRAVPANLAQLWAERHSFIQAFWGFFGGVNVPLPQSNYLFFNVIAGLGLLGLLSYFLWLTITRSTRLRPTSWLAVALTFIWPLLSFISYLRWTADTPASQGRLIFGTLAPIMLWLTVGLVWWLPKRLRPIIITGLALSFATIATTAPFSTIRPAYEKPQPQAGTRPPITSFSGIDLLDGRILSNSVQPGDYVYLDTEWRISQPQNRNWSLFVHLVTPEGVIISQRDIYPAQGLLATEDLSVGQQFRNPIAVTVPTTAYAPAMLEVAIGWYHLPTGERLITDTGAEIISIGTIELKTQPSPYPNPQRLNFGDKIELLGYTLSNLAPAAGETIELTLYWRALEPISADYKVFANIIDPRSLTKYATSDGMPAQWTAPTSTWAVGDVITDVHQLSVTPDAIPGIYELELGLYTETQEGFERLRRYTSDGGQADNFVYLSRVRIMPGVAEVEQDN